MIEKIVLLKKQLDACRPFSKDVLYNLEKWFEIELTYTSNAIEGNTLTRLETALVLEKGITVGGKPMKDHLEAINHQAALHSLKQLISKSSLDWNDILVLHQLILKSIDDENAGKIRTVPVRISGSTVILPNPLKVPKLIEEFVDWINQPYDDPVSFAALAHYKLVTIHPFTDGNGRTARLLMNLILMKNGYPPAIIVPKDRLKYIKTLESAQLGGSLDPYFQIIYKAVERSLQIYVKALNKEQPDPITNVENLLKIGEIAQSTQESVATIRYWTKIGLITVATTTPKGYQLYSQDTIEKCEQIRKLQQQRYTLHEIVDLINS